MASFKVRRPAIFNSGLTVTGATTLTGAFTQTGALTTGSLTVSSGSTKIGASGMAVGTTGVKFTNLIYGVLTVTSPSFAATAGGSNLIVAHSPFPNVAAGDKVFVQAGSLLNGLFIQGASATAASTIEVSWGTTACTAVAEDALVSLQYLAFRS